MLNENSVIRIDEALADYYLDCGLTDYHDNSQDNIGKFAGYCKANGIESDDIDEELTYDAMECLLIDFDQDFPLKNHINITNKRERGIAIFDILKHCHQYGMAISPKSSPSPKASPPKRHSPSPKRQSPSPKAVKVSSRTPSVSPQPLHPHDQYQNDKNAQQIQYIFEKMAKASSVPPKIGSPSPSRSNSRSMISIKVESHCLYMFIFMWLQSCTMCNE